MFGMKSAPSKEEDPFAESRQALGKTGQTSYSTLKRGREWLHRGTRTCRNPKREGVVDHDSHALTTGKDIVNKDTIRSYVHSERRYDTSYTMLQVL